MNSLKKKYILTSLLGSIACTFFYFYAMTSFGDTLNLDLIIGVIKPFGVLAFSGIIFSLFFLFFHESIFKSWLKHMAWWYLLGLLIVVLNTPIYSSSILHIDRAQLVFDGVILLAIITMPYIFWIQRKSK